MNQGGFSGNQGGGFGDNMGFMEDNMVCLYLILDIIRLLFNPYPALTESY